MRRSLDRAARRQAGVSLIELVLVLALLGMVALVAIPQWAASAASGHRRAAQAALLEANLHLQARRAAQGGLAADELLPESMREVRVDGRVRYRLELRVADDGHAYELRAVPQGSWAEPCGALSLNDVGYRRSASAPVTQCWR